MGGSTGATFNAHNNQNNASTTTMANENTNSQSSHISGGSSTFGSSKRGPGGSSYSSGTSFNLNQGTSQTALNKKTLSTNNSSSSNIGTSMGTNWGLSGKTSASQYAGAYVEEPEYLMQGWTAGQDSSYSSGGSTGANFNAHNNQNNASTTSVSDENTFKTGSTMSGGSSAFGSSKRGPGGSSYSSGTSFNLNQGTSATHQQEDPCYQQLFVLQHRYLHGHQL